MVAVCFCTCIAMVDLTTYRIPDALLVSFVIIFVIAEKGQPHAFFVARFATAVLSFFLFGIIWFHTKGMGFGDVKYAAVLGYVLGFERLIPAFIITAVLGMLIYLTGIFLFRWPQTTKIPFAPFMSAGAILAVGSFI